MVRTEAGRDLPMPEERKKADCLSTQRVSSAPCFCILQHCAEWGGQEWGGVGGSRY